MFSLLLLFFFDRKLWFLLVECVLKKFIMKLIRFVVVVGFRIIVYLFGFSVLVLVDLVVLCMVMWMFWLVLKLVVFFRLWLI